MDIATIAGLATGLTLVFLAILSGGSITLFIDVPSLMIVGGGTIAATLTCFPLKTVLSVIGVIKKAILAKMQTSTEIIRTIVKYAEKARKEGMLALEEESENEPNEFLRLGLRLAVDGTDPDLLKRILENDMDALERRHQVGVNMVQTMGTYAPAFGMIGTLVGLVQMLANMSDPGSLGSSMAVALITTFYGALFANAIFLPLATKLKGRSEEELAQREMIVEGIISIQSGDSPRIVEEKLKSFLAPREREALTQAKEKAA